MVEPTTMSGSYATPPAFDRPVHSSTRGNADQSTVNLPTTRIVELPSDSYVPNRNETNSDLLKVCVCDQWLSGIVCSIMYVTDFVQAVQHLTSVIERQNHVCRIWLGILQDSHRR